MTDATQAETIETFQLLITALRMRGNSTFHTGTCKPSKGRAPDCGARRRTPGHGSAAQGSPWPMGVRWSGAGEGQRGLIDCERREEPDLVALLAPAVS
jgi:hypothetical protein